MTRTYDELLRACRRVAWDGSALACVPPPDGTLALLPEAFARTASLVFLADEERCVLEQIRAHAHLELVAENELALAIAVAADAHALGPDASAAMMEIVRAERKHAALFRGAAAVLRGVLGLAPHVHAPLIAASPLGRALALLHVDITTAVHHLEGSRHALDPWFQTVLRLHWIEEAQHALLVEQLVRAYAQCATRAERDAGADAYLDALAAYDARFAAQIDADLDALVRATGRTLAPRERERVVAVQHQAYRATYLGAALAHPALQAAVVELSPSRRARLVAYASASL